MKKKRSSENEINNICIFCFKTNLEVPFTTEHIIPASIKGNLVLNGYVCKPCNDLFGENVDIRILHVPDIANALNSLGYKDQYETIIKHNYNIKGKLSEGTELRGHIVDGEIKFPYQRLPDGSELIPEDEAERSILKKLKRDMGLKKVGRTEEFIDSKFTDFWNDYKKSKLNKKLVSKDLQFGLIKRSAAVIETSIEPIEKINILPLIGKIVYEMLFFLVD